MGEREGEGGREGGSKGEGEGVSGRVREGGREEERESAPAGTYPARPSPSHFKLQIQYQRNCKQFCSFSNSVSFLTPWNLFRASLRAP